MQVLKLQVPWRLQSEGQATGEYSHRSGVTLEYTVCPVLVLTYEPKTDMVPLPLRLRLTS